MHVNLYAHAPFLCTLLRCSRLASSSLRSDASFSHISSWMRPRPHMAACCSVAATQHPTPPHPDGPSRASPRRGPPPCPERCLLIRPRPRHRHYILDVYACIFVSTCSLFAYPPQVLATFLLQPPQRRLGFTHLLLDASQVAHGGVLLRGCRDSSMVVYYGIQLWSHVTELYYGIIYIYRWRYVYIDKDI